LGVAALAILSCSEDEGITSIAKVPPFDTTDEYDFIDLVRNASVEEEPTEYEKIDTYEVAILGDTRRALFHHPPSSIRFQPIDLSERASLEFAIALNPTAWNEAGDGVTFKVLAKSENGIESEIYSRYIDPKRNPEQRRWIDEQIDLRDFAGQRTQFVFETDAGPTRTPFLTGRSGETRRSRLFGRFDSTRQRLFSARFARTYGQAKNRTSC